METGKGDTMKTATETRWARIADGYARGEWVIWDNGAGLGPAEGSGRWAVCRDGRWIANMDYLADAKRFADGFIR